MGLCAATLEPSEHAGKLQVVPSMLESPQKLLKVPEVAERLRVSVWSVYRLVEGGQLPAVRVGSGPRAPIRVSEAELEAWLFGQEERES